MDKKESSKTVHSESCERDPLFEDAARFIVMDSIASTSSLQRHYEISYNRANRIMDQLELAGIVGSYRGYKPREVLVDLPTLDAMLKK